MCQNSEEWIYFTANSSNIFASFCQGGSVYGRWNSAFDNRSLVHFGIMLQLHHLWFPIPRIWRNQQRRYAFFHDTWQCGDSSCFFARRHRQVSTLAETLTTCHYVFLIDYLLMFKTALIPTYLYIIFCL